MIDDDGNDNDDDDDFRCAGGYAFGTNKRERAPRKETPELGVGMYGYRNRSGNAVNA